MTETEGTPLLRVVRGNPSPEELAALIAVVTARSAAPAAAVPVPSAWADPARRLGLVHRPGPSAWRRSSLPA